MSLHILLYTRCELFYSQSRGAHGFPKAGVTFFSNVSPLEHQEEEEFEPLDPKREVFEEPAFAPLGLAQRWKVGKVAVFFLFPSRCGLA